MDVHDVTDLIAIITTDVVDEEFPEGGHLLILFFRNCSMRVVFPSGSRMEAKGRTGIDLNALIDSSIAMIHQCCLDMGREDPPEITVHRAPMGLTTAEQMFAWLQSLPGIVFGIAPPENMGFGGPLPPAGEAG